MSDPVVGRIVALSDRKKAAPSVSHDWRNPIVICCACAEKDKEIARLRAALVKHAAHDGNACGFEVDGEGKLVVVDRCTCGLDEALKAFEIGMVK